MKMKVLCAECGCVVDAGEIITPCSAHPDCCCDQLATRETTSS
jgi:hypothetical protein